MIRQVQELVDELMERLNEEGSGMFPEDGVMLNVAGRWTGIKQLTWDPDTHVLLIESED